MQQQLKSRDELPELFTRLGLTRCGVEVGVDQGHFACTLLARWGGHLFLVDDWKWTMRGVDGPARMAEALRNLAPFLGRCDVIQESSTRCATEFADASLDWVYIDANHAYDAVMADFKAWYPKVRSGGIFAGHDYFDSSDPGRLVAEHYVERPVEEYPQEQFADWGVKSAVKTLRWQLGLAGEPEIIQGGDLLPSFWWIKP